MLHNCVKPTCGKQYKDDAEEAFYCPDCKAEKQAIAAQIDARMASKPKKVVVSELQQFEQTARVVSDPSTGRQIFLGRA